MLAIDPPTSITQDYYTCYSTEYVALLNAIGVGTGDATFWIGIFSIFLSPLVYFLLQVH